jgi:hypothetical protein
MWNFMHAFGMSHHHMLLPHAPGLYGPLLLSERDYLQLMIERSPAALMSMPLWSKVSATVQAKLLIESRAAPSARTAAVPVHSHPMIKKLADTAAADYALLKACRAARNKPLSPWPWRASEMARCIHQMQVPLAVRQYLARSFAEGVREKKYRVQVEEAFRVEEARVLSSAIAYPSMTSCFEEVGYLNESKVASAADLLHLSLLAFSKANHCPPKKEWVW